MSRSYLDDFLNQRLLDIIPPAQSPCGSSPTGHFGACHACISLPELLLDRPGAGHAVHQQTGAPSQLIQLRQLRWV